ncbi:hypothetical protein HUJ04_003533 [Dendroctonus ponderosae]|nr:hypothetical protein HUJ04_003533 [Dendroctonus ponderosae]
MSRTHQSLVEPWKSRARRLWRLFRPLHFMFSGLTRPTMYSFPTGQYPYPMLSPEMSAQVATWTLRRDIVSIFKAYAEHVPDTGSGEFSKSLSERFARPSGLLSPFLTIQPNPVTSRTRSSSHTPRIPPCHSNTWAQTGIT